MKSVFLVAILALFSAKSYSITCQSLLSASQPNSVEMLLAPLSVENLVQNIDFSLTADPTTLDPKSEVIAYSISDTALISDLGLPIENFRIRDRIVETDYGYAVLDVDELRDWTLLQGVIANPKRAEEFIIIVANSKGNYPNAITKEAAEWLRWSVFAKQESVRKSQERFNNNRPPLSSPLNDAIEILRLQRAEFRRLIRQKEIFIFPFGEDGRGAFNLMESDDAQVVLATLARHFILSKLYVKRPSGEYIRVSEFLDRESLILISRYPELLASYPIFEGGQVSIDLERSLIGREDAYNIATRPIIVENRELYDLDFNAVVSGFGAEVFLDASFKFYFDDENPALKGLTGSDYERIFSEETIKMEELLASKTRIFSEITGYNLPVSTVIEDTSSETFYREFQVSFGEEEVPAHVRAAFFVFLALHN